MSNTSLSDDRTHRENKLERVIKAKLKQKYKYNLKTEDKKVIRKQRREIKGDNK